MRATCHAWKPHHWTQRVDACRLACAGGYALWRWWQKKQEEWEGEGSDAWNNVPKSKVPPKVH